MPVGKELKRIREASKMSAQKLADKMKVKVERLRKWEQRDINPKDEDAVLIEKFFGVALEDLHKIKRVPVGPRIANTFKEDEESVAYITKDELIKSLQETVESQKKIIKFLEFQLKQLLPNKGTDLFEIEPETDAKKKIVKT